MVAGGTMKFKPGDANQTALASMLKHEFLRCADAYDDFAESAKIVVEKGDNRRIAFKTYNAYARFIHHLYEFFLGAAAIDRGDDAPSKAAELAERYISSYAQRALTNRREAILNGTAPPYENHISYFPETIPSGFAREFRKFRNVVSGHVSGERATLNLSDFYARNHKFLGIMFRDAGSHWGTIGDDFPDLNEITAFTVMLRESSTETGNTD
jgi:hypothetical protein